MKNITIITSIIDTPNLPLSTSESRSAFDKTTRFEQTIKTISSIKQHIPNNKIILIECSNLSDTEKEYFLNNVDYILNIYDAENKELKNRIFSESKSMGEGTMTIFGLNYIINNNIEFDFLYKISGRYWLKDNFNFYAFNNNKTSVVERIDKCAWLHTVIYKLSKELSYKWLEYLNNSENEFIKCVSFEEIFSDFININRDDIKIINEHVNCAGYVAVGGNYYEM